MQRDGLMAQELALLLAGALMGEDGEIGERKGERNAAGLLQQLADAIDTIIMAQIAYKARSEAHDRSCLGSPGLR